MKKKTAYLLSTVLLFACGTLFSAPVKDPVVIDGGPNGIKFESIQKSQVSNSGGPITMVTIALKGIENPNKETESDKWIRNVGVELVVLYEDQKVKGNFLVFKSDAKLFAIRVGARTLVSFFIPWEAYEIYGLKKDPYAYKITLKVNGAPIEYTRGNIASFVSKSVLRKADPKAAFDAFEALIKKSSGYNENVMVPLPMAPFGIRYFQCRAMANEVIPTYIVNTK